MNKYELVLIGFILHYGITVKTGYIVQADTAKEAEAIISRKSIAEKQRKVLKAIFCKESLSIEIKHLESTLFNQPASPAHIDSYFHEYDWGKYKYYSKTEFISKLSKKLESLHQPTKGNSENIHFDFYISKIEKLC